MFVSLSCLATIPRGIGSSYFSSPPEPRGERFAQPFSPLSQRDVDCLGWNKLSALGDGLLGSQLASDHASLRALRVESPSTASLGRNLRSPAPRPFSIFAIIHATRIACAYRGGARAGGFDDRLGCAW